MAELDNDRLVWMFTQMTRIREFEDRMKGTFEEYPGVIRGHTHLADGAEASIVGSLATLRAGRPGDDHLPLPRLPDRPGQRHQGDDGRDLRQEDRPLRGLRRLDAPRRPGAWASSAPPASSARASRRPPAWPTPQQIRGQGQVTLCFFGDGATKQGAFAEALNVASLWKLPIVYVMENNSYNVVTRSEQEDANAAAGEPLSVKAKAFSMPGVTVDGNDPLAVYDVVATAVERARKRRGPDAGGVAGTTASRPTATSSPRPACRCTSPSTRRSRCSATSRSTRRPCAATRSRASAACWCRTAC